MLSAKSKIISNILPKLDLDQINYSIRIENLVNMKMPGYKELKSTEYLNKDGKREVIFYRNFIQGPLVDTARNLDFAIEGEGFFVLETPLGIVYTRDGRFLINNQGILVNRTNFFAVLGERGAIEIPDKQIITNQKGEIYKDKEIIDRFRIAVIKDKENLESHNGIIFKANNKKPLEFSLEEDYKIRQGYIENSNVNSVEQMGKMASDQGFDLRSKAVQLELQRIGKISEMLR